jgi:hypothetical protein
MGRLAAFSVVDSEQEQGEDPCKGSLHSDAGALSLQAGFESE